MKTKNDQLPPLPYFAQGINPTTPAAYIEKIRADIPTICPELSLLKELADREDNLAAAAGKFSAEEARAEHEAESAALRADPTPKHIEALKQLGSLQAKLEHYGAEARKLDGAALETRRQALPVISAATHRLAARIMELAAEARADEVRLFESWGIPAPEPCRIVSHVHRAVQEIVENLRRESLEGCPCGVGIRGFLRMLGSE